MNKTNTKCCCKSCGKGKTTKTTKAASKKAPAKKTVKKASK